MTDEAIKARLDASVERCTREHTEAPDPGCDVCLLRMQFFNAIPRPRPTHTEVVMAKWELFPVLRAVQAALYQSAVVGVEREALRAVEQRIRVLAEAHAAEETAR